MPACNAPTLPDRSRAIRRVIVPLFACCILYAIDLTCASAIPAVGNAYVTNAALPFDLIVFIPAVFYLTIVRRRRLSPLLVLPVIWAGMIASMKLAQANLPSLHLMLVPAVIGVEIAILFRESRRFMRVFRTARTSSANPHDWFSGAFFSLTRNEQVSHIAANEITLWYYVLASWRRKPDEPRGSHAFTCYRSSGYVELVSVIAVITAIEAFVVHLLVAQWSEIAALILTITSLYVVVFLVGNARAVVLNPLLVDGEAVTLRWGLFFNERIARDRISHIQSHKPDLPKRERMDLRVMGMPSCWIILREPVFVRTFTGMRHPISAISVSPDDRAAFVRLVQQKSIAEF